MQLSGGGVGLGPQSADLVSHSTLLLSLGGGKGDCKSLCDPVGCSRYADSEGLFERQASPAGPELLGE